MRSRSRELINQIILPILEYVKIWRFKEMYLLFQKTDKICKEDRTSKFLHQENRETRVV